MNVTDKSYILSEILHVSYFNSNFKWKNIDIYKRKIVILLFVFNILENEMHYAIEEIYG